MTNQNELTEVIIEQDKILIKIMNDPRIPSYIRQAYADMYNELHIKIVEK